MRHLTSEALIGFTEGRLTPEDKPTVEQHISSCAFCFAEASEWFLLLDLMKVSTLESAPEHAIRNCFAIYDIPKRFQSSGSSTLPLFLTAQTLQLLSACGA